MWILKIVSGAELADKLLPEVCLPQPLQRFTIGRDPVNSWPIADRTLAISGRHCEVIATPDGPALRDLSTNGTFVNGDTTRLAGVHLLRDCDCFELGPFVVAVSGPPMPTRPAVRAGASDSPQAAAAARSSPAVHDAAPQRGGDPAAMAAMAARGQAQARAGLTEILRVAAPSDHTDSELTKIRVAPPPPPPPPPPPSVSAPVPASVVVRVVAPPPPLPASASPAVTAAALNQALARGLGLPVSALQGHNPLHLVQQMALTARAATAALQQVMAHQTATRHARVGMQAMTPAQQNGNPLRAGLKLDPAVLALTVATADPVAVMQRSADELCEHEDHLLQALPARPDSLPG